MPDEMFKASCLLPIIMLGSCSNVAVQLIPFSVPLILEFCDIFYCLLNVSLHAFIDVVCHVHSHTHLWGYSSSICGAMVGPDQIKRGPVCSK